VTADLFNARQSDMLKAKEALTPQCQHETEDMEEIEMTEWKNPRLATRLHFCRVVAHSPSREFHGLEYISLNDMWSYIPIQAACGCGEGHMADEEIQPTQHLGSESTPETASRQPGRSSRSALYSPSDVWPAEKRMNTETIRPKPM